MQVNSVLFILIISCEWSWQASTPESMTYEAGVVEFAYERNLSYTPQQLLASNLRQYIQIMENAPRTLDIIVFPEMTLNEISTAVEIPDADDMHAPAPCDTNSFPEKNLVKLLSCLAKNDHRYVVVNIVTKVKCPDAEMIVNKDTRKCNFGHFSYYNTNLVFDRRGAMIARYRKFNLFAEPVNKPSKPELITFDTDFGVRFGTFICFDLIFSWPANEVIFNTNITDIVLTSMWFSELPFGTAVQLHQGFAYVKNINLLAAGASNPEAGSTGSVVYAGQIGPLVSAMHGSATTQLYTATVPKVAHHNKFDKQNGAIKHTVEEMRSLNTAQEDLSSYNISFLSDEQIEFKEICSNQICCTFNVRFLRVGSREVPYYKYAMAVYSGIRTFMGEADGGVIVCAIIACQSEDIATCGLRNTSLASIYHFLDIRINGNFPVDGPKYWYIPSTLDTSVMPLNEETVHFASNSKSEYCDEHCTMAISINTKSEYLTDILTFGILGRNFNLDCYQGAGTVHVIPSFLIILSTLLGFFNK